MHEYHSASKCLLLCLLTAATNLCYAQQQDPVFPIPEKTPNQLFYLQRTPNANTVIYELNLTNGQLNEKEPIHIFWIRYGERGQREELSSIQRKFAYGITTTRLSPDSIRVQFLADKKAIMYLKKDNNGSYHVYVTINGKSAILYKIFLHINGGSFWHPNIEYAELFGTDTETGAQISEKKPVN
ncbi:MAG: DUF4833 domain-containing protein [Bacteroidetes bacterium]|nr:DUF4833 domain-containing protein [Bacteroidota bacterium]